MTTRICPGCDAPVSSTSYRCAACKTKLPSEVSKAPGPTLALGGYFASGVLLMLLSAVILANAEEDELAVLAFILGLIGFGVMAVDFIAKGVELGIRRARRAERTDD